MNQDPLGIQVSGNSQHLLGRAPFAVVHTLASLNTSAYAHTRQGILVAENKHGSATWQVYEKPLVDGLALAFLNRADDGSSVISYDLRQGGGIGEMAPPYKVLDLWADAKVLYTTSSPIINGRFPHSHMLPCRASYYTTDPCIAANSCPQNVHLPRSNGRSPWRCHVQACFGIETSLPSVHNLQRKVNVWDTLVDIRGAKHIDVCFISGFECQERRGGEWS